MSPSEAAKDASASGRAPTASMGGRPLIQQILGSQPLWVAVAILIICVNIVIREPHFGSAENFYNISRNFSFIGITALGMTVVIIAGGIDLSIGSVMGLVGICCALTLQADYPWYVAVVVGFCAAAGAGAVNGGLIAYIGLPPFVVTLGMLSAARSLAVILSGQRVVSNLGVDGDRFKQFGAGSILGISNPVWFLVGLTIVLTLVMRFTAWGRHVKAIGGNEHAAILTGIPVKRIKFQTYVICALSGGLAAMLTIGWTGSAVNSMGSGYELRAIAATVIGGANLLGGEGSAIGALVGSVLIEVIRNALLMAGVDSNWQGLFVGAFIVFAVVLERVRGKQRE